MGIDLLLPQAYAFALLFLRTAGLVGTMPLLTHKAVPQQLRVAFAFAITVPIYMAAGMPTLDLPTSMIKLAGAGLVETLIGASSGLSCRMITEAAQAAGSLANTSMGLNYGSQLDPVNGAMSSAVAELFAALGLAALLAAGFHREAIVWLSRQAIETPPGSTVDFQAVMVAVMTNAITAASLGVRLAFPFLATVNIAYLGFGVLGRSAPQISLANVGFAIPILIGGFLLYLTAPQAAELVARAVLRVLLQS